VGTTIVEGFGTCLMASVLFAGISTAVDLFLHDDVNNKGGLAGRAGGWPDGRMAGAQSGAQQRVCHDPGCAIALPVHESGRNRCVWFSSRTAGRRLGLLGACIPGAKRGAAVELAPQQLAPQPAAEKLAEHKEAA
jgi:hypothetical protein